MRANKPHPLVGTMHALVKLDAHVHVWSPPNLSETYPYVGQLAGASGNQPPMEGTMEQLMLRMDEANIRGAMVVQPGCHQYDHSYVIHAIRKHPDRLVGCLLADPSPGDAGCQAIKKLSKEGFRAIRFNPYLWPNDQKMTNKEGRDMYRLAGELGLPVGHMPFQGLSQHFEEIETLAREYPETKCILDHYGFCNAKMGEDFERLLSLASYPHVYVKVSAHFRVSNEAFPHLDTRKEIRCLIDAFGADRIMFGTDFPWVTEKCDYSDAWNMVEEGDVATGHVLLTEEEKKMVYAGTLLSLIPGAWNISTPDQIQ